ncbi:Transcription factor spt8 [Malassezia cuniculi]|uniref:Transcription factor spt8 n=1 Tax=Malassezia cuniculi TaxID=948313 RepID=A0AAF0J4K2_9BASI|nr:Transcription factor spt8 [Malassezia cuniculi]
MAQTLDAYVDAIAKRRSQFVPDAAWRDTRKGYAIEPVGAAPHSTQIHAMALVQDASILLSGGADGYVRWYDLPASLNGRNMLTQNLRSTFVEGVTKGGVLNAWWGHAHYPPGDSSSQEPPLSAVHSLTCQREGLWGMSGGESGNINLWGIRHAPGATRHVFWKHTGAVSALALNGSQDVLISGGWDRGVHEWDLNTGQTVVSYDGCAGQISSILFRPVYSPSNAPTVAITPGAAEKEAESPDESMLAAELDKTLDEEAGKSAEEAGPLSSSDGKGDTKDVSRSTPESDGDSLFGEDDETQPMEVDQSNNTPGVLALPGQNTGTPQPDKADTPNLPKKQDTPTLPGNAGTPVLPGKSDASASGEKSTVPETQALPRVNVSELPKPSFGSMGLSWQYDGDISQFSNDILLTSTLSGQVLIWDRRVDPRNKKGVRALELPKDTPPWCASACWSNNGDRIYVGRRNETVDEWDVRMLPDLSGAPRDASHGTAPRYLRALRMPPGSGPVSSVLMLPNDQHLVCASYDNIRLWNTAAEQRSSVPFKIIAGHHGGTVSHMVVDDSAKLLLTASGDRGWFASSTETLLMHTVHPL